MITLIKSVFGRNDAQQKSSWTFIWGSIEVFGDAMRWPYAMLTLGVCIVGGTGTGKTRRLLLALLESLLVLRNFLPEDEKWAALIADPKLSFARIFLQRATAHGQANKIWLFDGRQHASINPLRSGLSAEKIAELLYASQLAGESVSRSAGAAHYERREVGALGSFIRLAQLSSDPSLRMVSKMVDAVIAGASLSCAHSAGQEALERIEILMADDERERRMVLSGINAILEPFRSAPWRSIFFEGGDFNLDVARDEGRILVCAFSPSQTNHLNTGLYVLKQFWFSTIMMRMDTKINCNRKRYCLYVSDEFQQLCGRKSEADFFAVRREALGCPIVAFQQISQIRSALGDEWETVLGLLSNKFFLRNPDPDTNSYAQKLGGEVETVAPSFTQVLEKGSVQYQDKSQTLSQQTKPRVPAEYFFGLPDGDAVFYGESRKLFWFPALGMSLTDEKRLRKGKWPQRQRLLSPRENRA